MNPYLIDLIPRNRSTERVKPHLVRDRTARFDLIPENRSTGWVSPYLIGIAAVWSALKFKSDQRVGYRKSINTALPALLPSTGLLLNSAALDGGRPARSSHASILSSCLDLSSQQVPTPLVQVGERAGRVMRPTYYLQSPMPYQAASSSRPRPAPRVEDTLLQASCINPIPPCSLRVSPI